VNFGSSPEQAENPGFSKVLASYSSLLGAQGLLKTGIATTISGALRV
jgi:hypothetical protein